MARLDRATQPPRVCAANEFRLYLGGIGTLALTVLVSAVLASCGVKSELERTTPRTMLLPENTKDPARPPVTLGQTGTATIPPYTTGP
jgi:hypothetical protein